MSAKEVQGMAQLYTPALAQQKWSEGKILVITGGTGNPFFSTDTAASLRAAEIEAEVVLKGTKVDGVFDCDPVANVNAKRFETLTFDEVLTRNLKVMDSTSISMCRDNKIPIVVFNIFKQGNLLKAIMGEKTGTVVYDSKSK
jgi:uridylate kinase